MIPSKKILAKRLFVPYLSKHMTEFDRNMGSTLTVTQQGLLAGLIIGS